MGVSGGRRGGYPIQLHVCTPRVAPPLTTPPDIKRAFQALALDEHREAFAPTLYHLPDVTPASDDAVARQEKAVEEAMVDFANLRYDQHTPMDRRLDVHKKYNEARRELIRMHESRLPQPELLQVWFPGVHINVGGGSSDTLKNEGDMEGELGEVAGAWHSSRWPSPFHCGHLFG
jgi:hypothetical protein